MAMKDKMHTGELYLPGDEEILKEQEKCLERLYEFNQTRPSEGEKRQQMLKEMLAELGENCYIEPPFHANFGGRHVHVTLATAGHPILPELRKQAYQYNMPIHIGRNCWLGSGVCVMPGVTIGDNTVIGAGSVVTKDIPANVVAYGTPCKVIREINEHDKEYYFKDRKIEL